MDVHLNILKSEDGALSSTFSKHLQGKVLASSETLEISEPTEFPSSAYQIIGILKGDFLVDNIRLIPGDAFGTSNSITLIPVTRPFSDEWSIIIQRYESETPQVRTIFIHRRP
jgi:hypothetical protein